METVHVEFQRVQTWLFAVPRLRVMVGANTMLGEVLRQRLPDLATAKNEVDWQLATGVDQAKGIAAADQTDPLSDSDNPADDARKGIISRDGGHFEARFRSGAEQFAAQAMALIRRDLPGIGFRIAINKRWLATSQVMLPPELSVFSPCAWTGRGLASATITKGSDRVDVSSEVAQRLQAGQRSAKGNAEDLATQLTKTTALTKFVQPQDFDALVGDGYLAVIHADGNAVGQGAPSVSEEQATFFHRNRVLLRRALKAAINDHCQSHEERTTAPLGLLMLGGDDVLIACRADIALPFVVSLSRYLKEMQADNGDAFCLTMGIGVVIAKPSVPFHRLHAVAEHLAGSAKRKYRGLLPEETEASIVDWAVYTASWADDPTEVRRRDWVRGDDRETHILSRRPVVVLGEHNDSLEGLLANASHLTEASRSQLRDLTDQLARGIHMATLAWKELAPETAAALRQANIRQPWQLLDNEAMTFATSLLDLVEVLEIPRLGRNTRRDRRPNGIAAAFTEVDTPTTSG